LASASIYNGFGLRIAVSNAGLKKDSPARFAPAFQSNLYLPASAFRASETADARDMNYRQFIRHG
jgi:hypothetical protein